MKAFKVLNNQSGMMAMMGAMMFTIAITTTLSTFYVYTLNQAKYHARIKEAYQLINIMESFATATRKAYDMGMSANAQGGNCPSAPGTPGVAPTAIPGAAGKVYCPSSTATCFKREDTNEEYCSTVSFASNVTIHKKTSYAETKAKSFLKSWRKGLNEFYLSPGLKQRTIDSDTILSNVIQKPRLLDWLAPKAYAQLNNEGSGYDRQGEVRPVPTTTPGETGVTQPMIVPPGQTHPGVGGGAVTSVSYVNCGLSENGSMCTSTTGGGTGTNASSGGEQKGADATGSDKSGASSNAVGDGITPDSIAAGGSGSTTNSGGYAVVTCQEMPAGNAYCSYCRPGQFCPSVGGTPGSDSEGISVRRDGVEVRKPLQIRQKFSIIM